MSDENPARNTDPLGCVVLFDIDGTLLGSPDSGPTAGFLSMNRAAEELTGRRPYESGVEFAGRTDVQISRIMLERAGEPDPSRERIEHLVARYLAHLEQQVEARPYVPLGDPVGAVGALRVAGAVVGLGTGNLARGSRVKLESAGIGDLFDVDLGGFGDDGHTRAEVLAVGARRCDPEGRLPVVVIGDTPLDVEAALAIGAWCIGTPYMDNTAEVLVRAGAHRIRGSLDASIVDPVRELVGRGPNPG